MTAAEPGDFFYVLDEGLRVLFADDDPILREFAQVHLATDDGRVLVAGDGIEACELVRREPVDIMLLDLEMPNLDGFGVLERLRADKRFARLPIIVVTGREDVLAIDRAFKAGATSFLVKPINWRLLTYQLRYVLRASRAETALEEARLRAREEARDAHEAMRRLAHEGAALLAQAMQGGPELRDSARRYAERLSETVAADAVAQRA